MKLIPYGQGKGPADKEYLKDIEPFERIIDKKERKAKDSFRKQVEIARHHAEQAYQKVYEKLLDAALVKFKDVKLKAYQEYKDAIQPAKAKCKKGRVIDKRNAILAFDYPEDNGLPRKKKGNIK